MGKKAFIAVFSLILSILPIGMLGVTRANPIGMFYPSIGVNIQSPYDGEHCVLPILVNFTSQSNFEITLSDGNAFFYALDGQDVSASGVRFTEVQTTGFFSFVGQATITNLTVGKHTIIIYYVGMIQGKGLSGPGANFNGSLESTTTQFTVDAKPGPSPSLTPSPNPAQSPIVSILSPPQNDSCFYIGNAYFGLTYETNSALSWVGYSIDGANNVTVTAGNRTLVHDFSSSSAYHTLTLYANDTSGNWATPQKVTYLFSSTPQPLLDYTPTPSPTIPEFPSIIQVATLMAVIVVGLLVYFRKRRRVGWTRKKSSLALPLCCFLSCLQ